MSNSPGDVPECNRMQPFSNSTELLAMRLAPVKKNNDDIISQRLRIIALTNKYPPPKKNDTNENNTMHLCCAGVKHFGGRAPLGSLGYQDSLPRFSGGEEADVAPSTPMSADVCIELCNSFKSRFL